MSEKRTLCGRAKPNSVPRRSNDEDDQPKTSGVATGNVPDPSALIPPKGKTNNAAFRRGEGFETVLERFGSLIHSVAHRYAEDGDEEEDLYQEACIRVWERRHSFRKGSLSVWIFRTVDRCCRNSVRCRKSRKTAAERYAAENPNGIFPHRASADPWQHVLRLELNARIRLALARLGTRQLHAFVLTEVEGYSARDAARIMGVKVSTIRSHIRHAKKKLREYLKEEE